MWRALKRAQIPLRVAMVLAAAYLFYVYLERHSAERHFRARADEAAEQASKFRAAYGGSALKIVAFYASPGAVVEDQSTSICYGVENARSLRIDPPMKEEIYPALNRCIAVVPEHDTRYTLTAEGNDGSTASADFTLTVLPDAASLPRITSFEVVKHTRERGRDYFTLTFAFENARTVQIDPPVFSPLEDSAPFGKFVVAPEESTTYTLTVAGKKGRTAQKQLRVEIPKS